MASGEPEEKLKGKKPMKSCRRSQDEVGFFKAACTIRWGLAAQETSQRQHNELLVLVKVSCSRMLRKVFRKQKQAKEGSLMLKDVLLSWHRSHFKKGNP